MIHLPSDVCPRLVEPELAEVCAAQLARNSAEAARNNKHVERAILRGGYAVCGYCGANMNVALARKGILVYRCPRAKNHGQCPGGHFTAGVVSLDDDAWFFATEILRNPQHIRDAVMRLKAETHSEHSRIQADLKAIDGKRAALEQEAKNLMDGLTQATVASARNAIAVRLDMVYSELEDCTKERALAEHRADAQVDYEAQIETFEEWARLVVNRIAEATYEQKRQALYGLGVKVTVWRSEHAPRYTMASTFQGLTDGLFMVTDEELAERRGRGIVTERGFELRRQHEYSPHRVHGRVLLLTLQCSLPNGRV